MKRFLPLLALIALASQAIAGGYVGEYAPGDTIDCKFATYRPSTGATFTLGGTPAVSAYKDNSTTQSTSGVTLSADFDSVTGLNNVRVTTASDGTFYSAGSYFSLIITTGTVDSVSVTGSEVCSFSLNKEAGLRPTTAARTLDVSTGGEAGLDWANIGSPTTTVNLSGTSTKALEPTVAARTLDVTATGEAGIDWANVGSPTTTVNLSGTTISTSQAVASVSGAVGSVTGAVASVTGNVGGNVTGSVGSVATGGITAASIASDAITAAKIANDAIGATEIADGAFDNATFGCTGGSFLILGVTDCGTAQAATGTTLQLRSAASFADDTTIGQTYLVQGSTQGYAQARIFTDYVGSTDTGTVDAWTVTPSGTITYYGFGTASSTGGSGLDAAGVRAAVGLASANLDTQLGAIDDYVDTEVAAIKTKTDFLPSATAGTAGGVFIAGTNAATTVTTAFTSTFTGNLTGSVGSVATGGITAASIATDAIGAAELASDAGTELATANWANATRTLSAGTNIVLAKGTGITGLNDPDTAAIADAVWDEAQSGHVTAGTFGAYLDSSVSGVSTGGVSAADIADAVLDEALAGHTTSGTLGERVGRIPNAAAGANGGLPTVNASNYIAGLQGTLNTLDALDTAQDAQHSTTQSSLSTLTSRVGTPSDLGGGATVAGNLADIEAQTDDIGVAGAGLTASDDATLAAIAALPAAIRDTVDEDQGGGVTRGCINAVLLAFAAGDISTTGNTTTWKDPSNGETRFTSVVTSAGNRTGTISCPTY